MTALRPRLLLGLGLSLGLGGTFFGLGCQTDNATVLAPERGVETPTRAEDDALTDGEIAGILEAVNQGEVDLARLAVDRASDPNVRDYAQIMIRDHTQARERLQSVQEAGNFGSAPSRIRSDLQSQVARIERDLENARGAAFDREYMTANIMLHDRSLRMARERLMPAARSEALQQHLAELTPVLENHLEMARRVREGQPLASR